MKIAYADLLKHICKKYFGWDGQKDLFGRTLLQAMGDGAREINLNYWVNYLIGFINVFKHLVSWDYVIVDDCRMSNEITRWDEEWDTTAVRVERLNFKSPLTLEQQTHISETALDFYNFDYIITSESGLNKLEIEVNKFLGWMEKIDV